MPTYTTPAGGIVTIPGIYTTTAVRSSLPGPLPAFKVPVILGYAHEGIPFNFDAIKEDSEPAVGGFRLLGTDGAVAALFGRGSDLHRASVWAKRHGLGDAHYTALNQLTRAKVVATSTGPVNEITIWAKKAGFPGNWPLIDNSPGSGVFHITPVRNFSRITTNVGGSDTRIVVDENEWIKVGSTIKIGSNTVNSSNVTVLAKGDHIDSDGQVERWITVSSAPGAHTVADYACVFEYDTQNKEIITPDASDLESVIAAVNAQSEVIGMTKHGDFSGATLIALSGATALREISTWGTVTDGTSPAVSATDSAAFVTAMNGGEWAKFLQTFRRRPQAYLVVSAEAGVHEDFRDYATAERVRGYPISVTTGVAWGSTTVATVTGLAAALDSQDVSLWAGGLNREAAYISLAGAVFGRRIEGGPNHNLTQDQLVYSSVEVEWDEIDSGELTALTTGGVGTYRFDAEASYRYVINQGISTLQDNAGIVWSESTAKTALLQQRDLADHNDQVLKADLSRSQLGANVVSADTVRAVLFRRAETSLARRGYITPGTYKITSVQQASNGLGWEAAHCYALPVTNDYMGVTTTILIGD